MSLATTIRDAVVTAINAAMTADTLTPKTTAIAVYEITVGLRELTGGRVIVMPSTEVDDLLDRKGTARREVSIDVGVQYKCASQKPADQVAELDPYLALAEAIGDIFRGKTVGTAPPCLSTKYPHGFFIPEHLEKFKVLTSVITLSFVSNQ